MFRFTKTTFRSYLTLLALLFTFVVQVQNANAQNNLEKGINYFNENKYEEARKALSDAINEPKASSDARILLSIMASIDKTDEEAFKEFMAFYTASTEKAPYLYALWNTGSVFGNNGVLKPEQLELLKQIIANPNTDGTLQAMAHQQLGNHYRAANNFKASNKEFDKIGTINDWQIAGTFENISGSGFDKNYDPIAHPENTAIFKNKYGAEVKWFNLPTNRLDRWIDFSYPFYSRNTINYAQTFINSPEDKEVQLRFGTSGSLKVWLNDQQIFSDSEERNNDMDTYIMKVKLNKGYNRILVQIGCSEITSSNFMARITDEKGNPITGLTVNNQPQSYTKSNNKVEIIANKYEAYFEKMVKEEPSNIIAHLLLAETYLHNDKQFETQYTLLDAKKIAPKSSFVRIKLVILYGRQENKTDLTTNIEWLKDNDPNNAISLSLVFNEALDKENYTDAEKILDKIESLYGKDAATMQKRIQLAAYNGKQDEIIKLANAGYKKYPDVYYFVDLKHTIAIKVDKNYNSAIAVLKKYLKKNYRVDAMTEMAEDYFNLGNIAMGISCYNTIIANDPGEPGNYYSLGNIYFQVQNYDNALKNFNKAHDLAPYIGNYYASMAKTYETKKQNEKAMEAYQRAIVLYPTDYDSRKALRKLENKKEIFDYFKSPDVYQIAKNAPDAKEYPEDNSVILLDETQNVVYKGGASEEKHVIVIKMFNSQGVDKWKEYNISYNGMQRLILEKAEVIKANGSKVEAESKDYRIVFTTLEVGDAIHISYRLENYLTGKLAPHFWDKVYFRHFFPYQTTKYSLLISPDVKFSYKMTQGTFDPVKNKPDADFDLYVWEKNNVASVKNEDHMPQLVDIAPVLFISSFPDWNFISNWYADLTTNKSKSDYEIKETVESLFKDKQHLSQEEKVKEIYNFIVNNIRYSSVSFLQSGLIPQKASKVLITKIGDCKDVSTLFVALCREIGVDAELVLVKTRDNGKNDLLLPSIDFNHCIAKVMLNQKPYYIELTSDYLPFNSFYTGLINAYTLDIQPENSGKSIEPVYLNPPTRSKNIITRNSTISFDGNDVVVTKDNFKTGAYAADMRNAYRDLGKKEQEKEMQKAVTGEYPNVMLNALDFKGLNGTNDTIEYKYSYVGQNAITQVSGLNLFSIPWAAKASSNDFIFSNSREFPMDLVRYMTVDKEMETIAIEIPANKKLSEIPKSISYSCDVAEYNLNFKMSGNKLIATRQLKFKKDEIPVEKIKEFGEFYKKVITSDAKQFAFN